jgi:hypothetical protein
MDTIDPIRTTDMSARAFIGQTVTAFTIGIIIIDITGTTKPESV